MKEESKEKNTEKDQKIIVLDKGIISGDDPGPQLVCCAYAFFPLRW
jgi:hypothetical protein